MRELDEITGAIVDAAIQIHRKFGPGLLESVYETALTRSLANRGFEVERQKPISNYIDFVRSPDSKPNNKIVKLNAITIGTIIAPPSYSCVNCFATARW